MPLSSQAKIFQFFSKIQVGYLNRIKDLPKRRAVMERSVKMLPLPSDVLRESFRIEHIPAEWLSTPNADPYKIFLYLHGGAFIMGSMNTHRNFAAGLGKVIGMRTLIIEYRLAPEHPFPAALEDSVSAYRWLLTEGFDPAKIIIAGDSAGGGLALSTLLSLRDQHIPLPAGGVCLSPWTDLARTGSSNRANAKIDPISSLVNADQTVEYYAGDHDPKNPAISPLYADLSGLPPLLIQVGTDEVLLDDSTRLAARARQAGVDITYEEWPGMFHVFQMFSAFIPEAQQAVENIGRFARRVLSGVGVQQDIKVRLQT